MKKIILSALYLFFINQNFCGTDYIKIVNNVSNKTLGTICLTVCGGFLTKSYFRLSDAWEQHNLLINHKPSSELCEHSINFNKRTRSYRNQYLKRATMHLALAGLFGYSAYYYFKK